MEVISRKTSVQADDGDEKEREAFEPQQDDDVKDVAAALESTKLN